MGIRVWEGNQGGVVDEIEMETGWRVCAQQEALERSSKERITVNLCFKK